VFLALSLARNRRAPTELELFAEGPHPGANAFEIGDRSLGSETVNSAEVTARYGRGDARLEVHAYLARYDGFIDERPTGKVQDGLPVFAHVQTDARFVGAEAEASYPVWRSGEHKLRLVGAFDWVRGTTDLGPAARIPPWSVVGRLIYEAPLFDVRAELRHVAEQDRVADLEPPTDGYTAVDLYASVKPWKKDVRLFMEGRNLTDAEIREHVSFLKDIAPQPGRSVRMGVTASF
jgi:iron complex outermembrane receptor protein